MIDLSFQGPCKLCYMRLPRIKQIIFSELEEKSLQENIVYLTFTTNCYVNMRRPEANPMLYTGLHYTYNVNPSLCGW